jgi:hypothetical protein
VRGDDQGAEECAPFLRIAPTCWLDFRAEPPTMPHIPPQSHRFGIVRFTLKAE